MTPAQLHERLTAMMKERGGTVEEVTYRFTPYPYKGSVQHHSEIVDVRTIYPAVLSSHPATPAAGTPDA